MGHARRLLLSASHFQSIASASRHQLRVRRRPVQFSTASRIGNNTSRAFTSQARLRQDEPVKEKEEKDDGAATLPEETAEIARAADEPPKPSDLETAPEGITPTELAEATAQAIGAGGVEATEAGGIAKYFGEEGNDAAAVEADVHANADVDTATIIPHGTSEAHQDLREYARLAAWELPLLHKLKKPFIPPTSSTPLRFRYTSYLGDSHPASRKVVLEFKPSELPGLSEKQTIKLIKLAGTRYNPEKQLIKMSSDSFETPAQNKRYLGDLVQKLVKEAKDGKDTLEDVPVDLRHHKQKAVYKFPEEWKIERPARIEQGKRLRGKGRQKRQVIERLQEAGQLVDGERVVRDAMAAVPVARLGRADGQKTVLGTRTGKAPVKGRQAATTNVGW